MKTTDDLIRSYYDWLKAKTAWREINDWVEITTPYLDRHNDYIQIYLRQQGNEWVLTDDGYTLADLAQSGCEIDTPRRKALWMIRCRPASSTFCISCCMRSATRSALAPKTPAASM